MFCYSHAQFLQEYELSVDEEFCYRGKQAQWATGLEGPRFWGDEDASIALEKSDPIKATFDSASIAGAVTPDGRYFAAATNATIRIYNIDTLTTCSQLIGHTSNVRKMFFTSCGSETEAEYILLTEGAAVSGGDGETRTWYIDGQGGLSKRMRSMPIAVQDMATRAMDAIEKDLKIHHEFEQADIEAVHKDFVDTLNTADIRSRGKLVPAFPGHFPGFNTDPVSHDGQRLMRIIHGDSTQSGMRPPNKLPQIVISETVSEKEICRLKGHEDAIMWAGWSLDDKLIATAAWDETYRLWDAETGECRHTIGKTRGQNWAGGFLPDGRHVLLSGGSPVKVGIYDTQTAEETRHLDRSSSIVLNHWMRYFVIHPQRDLVILQNNTTLLAWASASSTHEEEPTDLERIFSFTSSDNSLKDNYAQVSNLKFADHGKKLLAQSSEDTTFVWDMEQNLKWRFQRPKGVDLVSGSDVFFVHRKGSQWVLSLDGDHHVRLWKL
nr:wd repeat-containing protein 5 like [Quercus suber]